MNVSLTPQLEKMIASKVKTGGYQTASEVVREALRLLKQRDEDQRKLREDVLAGFAQVERGEFVEYDDAKDLVADIKKRGRKRLLAEQPARKR